jgi:hypothetical protein
MDSSPLRSRAQNDKLQEDMPGACPYKDAFSIKTVRTHLRNICQKLHVRSRTEAVLMYLRK